MSLENRNATSTVTQSADVLRGKDSEIIEMKWNESDMSSPPSSLPCHPAYKLCAKKGARYFSYAGEVRLNADPVDFSASFFALSTQRSGASVERVADLTFLCVQCVVQIVGVRPEPSGEALNLHHASVHRFHTWKSSDGKKTNNTVYSVTQWKSTWLKQQKHLHSIRILRVWQEHLQVPTRAVRAIGPGFKMATMWLTHAPTHWISTLAKRHRWGMKSTHSVLGICPHHTTTTSFSDSLSAVNICSLSPSFLAWLTMSVADMLLFRAFLAPSGASANINRLTWSDEKEWQRISLVTTPHQKGQSTYLPNRRLFSTILVPSCPPRSPWHSKM